MDNFLKAAIRAVNRHGTVCDFKQVQEGSFDYDTGLISNTEVSYSLKLFKNHIKANQYNYPNLVGKDAAEFYLPNNCLSFKPEPKDKIVQGTDTYTVDSVKEHWAMGNIAMYTIIAVKN